MGIRIVLKALAFLVRTMGARATTAEAAAKFGSAASAALSKSGIIRRIASGTVWVLTDVAALAALDKLLKKQPSEVVDMVGIILRECGSGERPTVECSAMLKGLVALLSTYAQVGATPTRNEIERAATRLLKQPGPEPAPSTKTVRYPRRAYSTRGDPPL